jgi:uncharacterized membrane protein YdfJ with MMPL/SSD domain
VRGLLVPATMRLLGTLNWWWPAPLNRWLPEVVFREARVAATAGGSGAPAQPHTAVPVGGE